MLASGSPSFRPLLTVLLLVAVGMAGAQSPAGDACTAVGTPDVACKVVDTASNGVAWTCRATTGSVTCGAIDGRSITELRLQSYLASDAPALMAELRADEDDLPLRETFWLSTHNSFNTPAYGLTLSHFDSNQQFTITDQFRMGARGIEIDLHWMPSTSPDGMGSFAPIVCHGRGADQGHFGCTTEGHLDDFADEIRAWLDAHPEEVIVIDVQDELDHQLGDAGAHDAAAASFDRHLGDRLYRPDHHGAECGDGFPGDVSRNDIRATGAQVVLASTCGNGAAWDGITHGKSPSWVQESWPWTDAEPCHWSGEVYGQHWTRTWEDSTLVGQVAPLVGLAGESEPISSEDARHLVGCGINMLSLDQLMPDDGRLTAIADAWWERGGA